MSALRLLRPPDLPTARGSAAPWLLCCAMLLTNVGLLLALGLPMVWETHNLAAAVEESRRQEEALRRESDAKLTALIVKLSRLENTLEPSRRPASGE